MSNGVPSDLAAQHLFDSLRALNRKPTNTALAKTDVKLIDSLERRLRAALVRDKAGTITPDGYPISTGGGASGNGPTIAALDENGAIDHVPATAVEVVAIGLAEDGRQEDRHRDLTRRAAEALENAVIGLNTLVSALASLDDLTNDRVPALRTCSHCTGKRGQNGDRPVAHRGTVGDRLERPLDLCEACWWFVQQAAKPGSRAGCLPTDAQIRHHEERGRWRVKVA